jgi:hypothetical protein
MADRRTRLRDCNEIREYLASLDLSEEERDYARMMLRRFRVALDLVEDLLMRRASEVGESGLALLEVAPHLLTELFSVAFPVAIHTVGVSYRDLPRERRGGQHLNLDLNDAHRHEGWRGFHKGDVVFMGEIIEHLHASPRMVMGCASRWVKDGGWLVVQTPNAAALERRLVLLGGKNPYARIRTGEDPGHFREYTARELDECGRYWGLELEAVLYHNYFDLPHRGPLFRVLYGLTTSVRGTLRDGMTLVFRKPEGLPDPRATSRDIRGLLEQVRVEGDVLHVCGWATDRIRGGPAGLVELVHGDFTFHGQAPDVKRPDVVEVHEGNEGFLSCGFQMEVPCPEGFDPDLLIARTRDVLGDWYDLPRRG